MGGKTVPKGVVNPEEGGEGSQSDTTSSGSTSSLESMPQANKEYLLLTEDEDEKDANDPTLNVSEMAIADYAGQMPMFEEVEGDEPEEELFPEGHIVSTKDIPTAVLTSSKKVHVSLLMWDKDRVHGQNRALQSRLVDHYVTRLTSQPPRRLVRILGKQLSGM